jgi:predicted ATP-dependent protease
VPAKPLAPDRVGLPRFAVPAAAPKPAAVNGEPAVFGLTSHQRAREALEFGLGIPDLGFNIFVLGENRSGRMTATLDYLGAYVKRLPPAPDWVYLNNFEQSERPRPHRLPAGTGRRFRDRMSALMPAIEEALKKTFGSPEYAEQVRQASEGLRAALAAEFEDLQKLAQTLGVELRRTEQGIVLVIRDAQGQPRAFDSMSDEERAKLEAAWNQIKPALQNFSVKAENTEAHAGTALHQVRRAAAARTVEPLIGAVEAEFNAHPALASWLAEMREDMVEMLGRTVGDGEGEAPRRINLAERYLINLLVDHTGDEHPAVVLEPNPSYENLFGTIQYRSTQGVLETNFTMIRAGALHRANGGVLVLRAEALARQPQVWEFLKGALRDREIRIEELHRFGSLPMTGAPRPKPIPLELKVVVVGAPRWYYAFFSVDPDFQSYFKVKADIDADLEATADNVSTYADIIRHAARHLGGWSCEDGAVGYLLGEAARWAKHRDKLSAHFEQIEDVVAEAGAFVRARKGSAIAAADVKAALDDRRRRNARVEDRSQELIRSGTVMIDVTGVKLGQINALTVRDLGDHTFGTPSRVTARTYAGELGVINIERMIDMGGPIQQKGVYVLSGFLNGLFARSFPLSFSASITFEQNYGGVEGDSASMAELLAILSSLAGVALRQDLGITGSVNQQGETQAIGGANHKIEGFFRTCSERGLTGTQGVLIPAANEVNLALRPEIADAIGAGQFHVWSVATVDEAIELFTGMPAGAPDEAGNFPADTVYGRVMAQLARFDRALTERSGRRG